MTDTGTQGRSTGDRAVAPAATGTEGCCANQSAGAARSEAGAAPCCGTHAEAQAAHSCCGDAAKTQAVAAGAGCCG